MKLNPNRRGGTDEGVTDVLADVPYDLVIFDCDGVLVDSEKLTNTIFAEMLNGLGVSVTLEDMFDQFVGRSMTQCLEIINGLLGRPVPPDFVETYRSRCKGSLEQNLKPVHGVREILEQLDKPFCVASSGDFEKMRMTLGITNLLPFFEGKLFSAVQVARGKPFPDVFLLAAEMMGVAPSRCVVIEDTPVGVQAGVAAGMTVLGYAEMMNPGRLKEAGALATFAEMSSLLGILVRMNKP